MEYHGIALSLEREELLTEFAKTLLKEHYMLEDEVTVQEALARASLAYSYGDLPFAQRIYDYASRGWFMFASPVLSNAPKPGLKPKALPISCFLTFVDDSLESLIEHSAEIKWLSVKGGGVGGHWSKVRAVSKKAPGPIPFIKTVDADIIAYKQGSVRRGSYAAYMDVSHPDIEEFLQIRVPTGGDPNRKCFNIHNAVNVTDKFMMAVASNDDWNLLDPNDGTVRSTLKARDLWQRILETRFRTGEPYIHFIDTSNKHLPECQKELGLRVNGSNLCSEIIEATSDDRTAVCCLSSLNLELYDEWKDTDIVRDLVRFLDNVLQFFIDNCPDVLSKAKFSATRERSLGLGTMGFHSLLQSKMIPWESIYAKSLNFEIFEKIQKEAVESSIQLARERGVYPDAREMKVTVKVEDGNIWQLYSDDIVNVDGRDIRVFDLSVGDSFSMIADVPSPSGVVSEIIAPHAHWNRRNAHIIAIAPNANNSIILNTSPSIEPIVSNAYTHRTRVGTTQVLNKFLTRIIEERLTGEDRDAKLKEIWSSITTSKGSVQHLDILTDDEKEVFKTGYELDQNWVVELAGDRQTFICQAQSLNLFFPYGSERHYVNSVHLRAWKVGLKSLYYLRSEAGISADKVSQKVERKALADFVSNNDANECLACHG